MNNAIYLTLGQAAKETGKSKATISKALKSGKLSYVSKSSEGYQIDPAELFRAFPNPVRSEPTETVNNERLETPKETLVNTILERENNLLRGQLDKAEAEKDRLLSIIEKQALMLEYKPEQENQPAPQQPTQAKTLSWLQATLIGLGVAGASITITVMLVTWVLPYIG